jgi:hypothetical protein
MEPNRQSYRAAKRAEIAERRAKVSELYLNNGWTVYRIARELGCSVATVSEDKQALTTEWKQRARLNFEEHIAVELKKIGQVEQEAHESFEKSKLPKRIASASKRSSHMGVEEMASASEIQRPEGDPRFLAILLKCSEDRMRLLGLNGQLRDEDDKKQTATTFSQWVAAHLKQRERNGNGTSPTALPPPVRLDPGRLS